LALAVVVVFSAALLGRGLINFARLDPGYDVNQVISVTFNASASGYQGGEFRALGNRLVDAVTGSPGFVSATVSRCGLLDNCSYSSSFVLDGDRARGEISIDENHAGPGYFSTTGIPIIAGREFTERDREGGAPVAIVSQSVASRYFAGGNPAVARSATLNSPPRSSVSLAISGRTPCAKPPWRWFTSRSVSGQASRTISRSASTETSVGLSHRCAPRSSAWSPGSSSTTWERWRCRSSAMCCANGW
jgi:hypothetical protein